MAGKCLLGLLLMSFLTAPSFSQDTIYIDRKNKWLESKEGAVRYCVRTYLKKDSIEVRYYNLGDTLLLIHHFRNLQVTLNNVNKWAVGYLLCKWTTFRHPYVRGWKAKWRIFTFL